MRGKILSVVGLGANVMAALGLENAMANLNAENRSIKRQKRGRHKNAWGKSMAGRVENNSRYFPHQGKRERARRIRQGIAGVEPLHLVRRAVKEGEAKAAA